MAQTRSTVNSAASGIALAHTVHGDPVTAQGRANSTLDGVEQATFTMMRPYQEPKRRHKDNGKTLCATDGCRAYPTATGHCVGHSRSMGLIENWNQEGRKTNEPD
jgi:hypothetical protein